MSGLTDTGYEPRTQAEIFESQQAFLRATISAKLILTDKTVLGNWVRVTSDHLALLEEAQEESYNAYDRDSATSDRLSSLMTLMGVPRRTTSTTGLVSVTLTLGAGQSFAAGDLVAAVDGEPDNTWHNRDAVTSVGSGSYTAVFESDLTGPEARALAGTLTDIPTPVTGWTAITNPSDAQAGKGPETDAEGRVRLAQAVGSGGSNHVAAVRAALVAVQGVLSADVFENRAGSVDSNGVPGHSIRCVVWDGNPAVADDDDIAQAIWDHSATFAAGAQQGEAQDEALGTVTVNFDRATASAITVAVAIESAQGVTKADVIAALIAAMPGVVGAGITLHKLAKAVFDVPGVDDYGTFTINGGTSDLAAVQTTIYTLSSGSITVTGDAT